MGITISNNDNTIDITTNTDSLIIANNVSGETITVDAEQTSVVTVATPGPKGDPYLYGDDDDVLFGNITGSVVSSSGGFTGSLHGNADTATTATVASSAGQIYVNNDETGDTNNSILFSNTGGAGNRTVYEDSNLYYDNTNNDLHVTGGVYSGNTYTIAMSGVFNPQSGKITGPSLEGKYGVQWSLLYGSPTEFPDPASPVELCTYPSALATTGYTVPYKSVMQNVEITCGGTRWKESYTFYIVYVQPRTGSQPLAGATEAGMYLGPFNHRYTTPNTIDPIYGIAPPSLAEQIGPTEPFNSIAGGGFLVPLVFSDSIHPVFVDVQIKLKRI